MIKAQLDMIKVITYTDKEDHVEEVTTHFNVGNLIAAVKLLRMLEAIGATLTMNNRIAAIKLLRKDNELLGLKEAKDLIELWITHRDSMETIATQLIKLESVLYQSLTTA